MPPPTMHTSNQQPTLNNPQQCPHQKHQPYQQAPKYLNSTYCPNKPTPSHRTETSHTTAHDRHTTNTTRHTLANPTNSHHQAEDYHTTPDFHTYGYHNDYNPHHHDEDIHTMPDDHTQHQPQAIQQSPPSMTTPPRIHSHKMNAISHGTSTPTSTQL